ncbi:MAG TPA: bifunctional hydroxymethylpyrimidine kinase/phosphomethylpyrimidine kinase [Syntrophales bacterium]|jgi:hydroxymethylpyrimidine kinase/phosphomethylpyrimidine kinase|nr:bifunctional hydroxymethylpyrimidine kinase/phosphomethylpyrimidine kinase [Syntrophales bacterium]
MKPARVLTIAGSDSGGGAGIQGDLKTITVLGGFGMSVVTALTAQNSLGVHGIFDVPPEFVEKQFDAVMQDIGADAAKTGMLARPDILRAVIGKIRQYRIDKLVVDPVMVAKGGTLLLRGEIMDLLRTQLIPLAFVVTPNIPEAEVLAGVKIAAAEDVREAARRIRQMGARHVVVKGGHLEGAAVDVFYDGNTFHEFKAERIDTSNTHGTGCTFSAALATGIAQGKEILDAISQAKEYITEAIRNSFALGSGHGPLNHLAPVAGKWEKRLHPGAAGVGKSSFIGIIKND